jgi:hypothetical protein
VLRTTIRADENTDVEEAVNDLRAQCETAGIGGPIAALVAGQIREVLSSFVTRGKQLASQGSQLTVTREVAGDGYSIRVVFGAGVRRTFWERLIDTLRGK